MSSLWTPGGERPIRRDSPAESPEDFARAGPGTEPTEEEVRAQIAAVEEELARTPVHVVVANHALGLFNLARLHLSLQPPQLDQARLAIDAMAALVEGLGDRLGEDAPALSDGLGQLRIAYVQIHAAQKGRAEAGAGEAGAGEAGAGEAGAGAGSGEAGAGEAGSGEAGAGETGAG